MQHVARCLFERIFLLEVSLGNFDIYPLIIIMRLLITACNNMKKKRKEKKTKQHKRTNKLSRLNDINIHCSVLIPMLTLIAHPDFHSTNFSCGRNHTLVLREDISEMETAARKFEKEGGILEEILERAKSNQDLYSYPLSNLFQKAEEEGYSAYCSLAFRLNPDLDDIDGSYSQEKESYPTKQALTSGAAEIFRTEMSETSCSSKPNNVRFCCFLEICFSSRSQYY